MDRINYYDDFLSPSFKKHLLKEAKPYPGIPELMHVGETGGLENTESFKFLCELFEKVQPELAIVLKRRIQDRKFIDERTKSCVEYNKNLNIDFLDPEYKTILGLEDGDGRIVIGPKTSNYCHPIDKPIAPIPDYLQGNHVTLFGPPDNAKLSINAMNAFHRRLKDEPAIVEELLKTHSSLPKWGADDEDSKTQLREDLIDAGKNLTGCLEGNLELENYKIAQDKRSLPIKRFPGLALPCFFLFYKNESIPLHLYDFALHFFRNWNNPKALAFYVPKLENEEEARYIRIMLQTAEEMMNKLHSTYKVGSIRLMIVLENPRAVFRAHEIMDELYPYFAGASLGWHDYLASTARLFKEDPNYRIPVKADPDIVIKYIKASHDLLAEVVGPRGGIKVGGMYGILPISNDLKGASFQLTLKGYIRDVVTQFKRNLSGFWVAHPDFVRLGLALVEAWKFHKEGDSSKLDTMVTSILDEKYHKEILDFIHGPDIKGLNKDDSLYARSLIVADLKESDYIANNHPDEIRYNVFQSLQYITDWLSGNGCVALPATISGIPVRVMDDLATAERSRWEVWHEIYHNRFSIEEFVKIAHEEFTFIRKDLSNEKKIVQVKWDERTSKWYPVALKLMIKLMTDKNPVEFATQLFLPFTDLAIRAAQDPWQKVTEIDSQKFSINSYVDRFNYYFEMCGCKRFASIMARNLAIDFDQIKKVIFDFSKSEILEAASFHGDIGEGKKTLDKMATSEQAKVFDEDEHVKVTLKELGQKYLNKFGMKFLVSAQGKTGKELLAILEGRINNSELIEIQNAKEALWQITIKRINAHPISNLHEKLDAAFNKHQIKDAQIAITSGNGIQSLNFGSVTSKTWFEMASLSKTVGSAFAIEYFTKKGISLNHSVDELLALTKSDFRLNDPRVKVTHLMNHMALNMHYVNGVPANKIMPKIRDFLSGNREYGYVPVRVENTPGEVFQYSGGGFLVLEHLIEALEEKSIFELTSPFLHALGMTNFSFEQQSHKGIQYAVGFDDKDNEIEGSRKMFPAFAAGSMGTAEDMLKFLVHLEKAFHDLDGSGSISHDTAVQMLHGQDKGCKKFMGVKIGLGIFIAEAGENRFAIHQGANDGFRCIYLHCFSGPDRGKGLVALCNRDLKGVMFNAEVTQEILKAWNVHGVDFEKFKSTFKAEEIPQEEIVNMGYKNLVFNAFQEDLPEKIIDQGPKDPLASTNLVVGAKISEVTDQKFARAENLISDHLPKFNPELFGKQGKIMDSWETVRHNLAGIDSLVLELKKPSAINYILLSTKYHSGNYSPFVSLEGWNGSEWEEFLAKTPLEGHSELRIALPKTTKVFNRIKVKMHPDGGFTRLGLFYDVADKASFDGVIKKYNEAIPHPKKPLTIKAEFEKAKTKSNLSKVKGEFNNASVAYGAKLVSATDEHYGPAVQMLSPFGPINMFDGLESARSRKPNHHEEVTVQLAKALPIHRIEFDFTYFVNNNPLEIEILGLTQGKWKTLVQKTNVKAFAGNKKAFEIQNEDVFEQIKLKTYPDGGLNRFKAFSLL
jgi:allantoicase/malate synthase